MHGKECEQISKCVEWRGQGLNVVNRVRIEHQTVQRNDCVLVIADIQVPVTNVIQDEKASEFPNEKGKL
jgi:hypothetical protein